jgi:hypothetical protein
MDPKESINQQTEHTELLITGGDAKLKGDESQFAATPPSKSHNKNRPNQHWCFGEFLFPAHDAVTVEANEKLSNLVFGQEKVEKEEVQKAMTLFVSSMDQATSRRDAANTFFLSINTAGIASITLLMTRSDAFPLTLVLAVAGVLSCILWFGYIRSYWLIGKSKVELLKVLESKLSVMVFTAQYELMKANRYDGFADLAPGLCFLFGLVEGILAFVSFLRH